MTQKSIKEEIEQHQQAISFANDRIKYLRSICRHVNSSYDDTCSFCGKLLMSSSQYFQKKTSHR